MKYLLLILSLSLILPCFAAPQAGDFFASGPSDQKRIALTFDDGPGPWTDQFLELLDRYNVKATFFMEGEQVQFRAQLAKRVAEKGHEIGSHTMKHLNYVKRLNVLRKPLEGGESEKRALQAVKQELLLDLQKSREIIERTTGQTLLFCRMPHGADRPWIHQVAKEAGFVLVNWTFGADWTQLAREDLKKSYVSAIKPGAILLFHDGGKNRSKSLIFTEAVLRAAQEKGFEIVTVGQLLGAN